MKKPLFGSILISFLFAFSACDDPFEDEVPESFLLKTQVNPDDIYLYGGFTEGLGVRLDPLVNDSIKVDLSVSYSTPEHGTITFIQNEGWFYKPDADFFGQDHITYTVCFNNKCISAPITMHVETPIDPDNCTFEINGESVETFIDQPIAIRIYGNDMVCPYMGGGLFAPEKGRFDTFSYSGSFKNIVYVYYPPKGFTGTDRFKYKLFTNGQDLEAWCTITVK